MGLHVLLRFLVWTGLVVASLLASVTLALLLPVRAILSGRAWAYLDNTLEDPEDSRLVTGWAGRLDASLLGGFVVLIAESGAATQLRIAGLKTRVLSGASVEKDSGHKVQSKGTAGGKRIAFGQFKRYLSRPVRKQVALMFGRLRRVFWIRTSVNVHGGFDDPGVTGMLYGFYHAARGILALDGLTFRPDFTREMLDGTGTVEIRVCPFLVLLIALRFMLARDVRALWWKRGRPSSPRGTYLIVPPS